MLFEQDKHVVIAQGALPEFEADNDPFDRLYIPARWAIFAALCKNVSIVLPGTPEVRDMVSFLNQTVGTYRRQSMDVLWTSGHNYLLDRDIAQEAQSELAMAIAARKNHGINTRLVPYRANNEFLGWARNLVDEHSCDVVGDDQRFIQNFGNKTILHPNVNNPNKLPLFHDLNVNIPSGYVCDTLADLPRAYELLSARGVSSVMIKPAHGSTGEGIVNARSMADVNQYSWEGAGPFIIEECLVLSRDDRGNEINCSLQFVGARLVGQATSQIVSGTHWQGNVVPGILPEGFATHAEEQARLLLGRLSDHGLRGPGGFDFLNAGGKPFLVDPNLGRFTGAHIPKFIAHELLSEQSRAWATLEMSKSRSVGEVWELLQSKGLAMNFDTMRGVFPFCHLRNMWAMHMAFASSGTEALHMLRSAQTLLASI